MERSGALRAPSTRLGFFSRLVVPLMVEGTPLIYMSYFGSVLFLSQCFGHLLSLSLVGRFSARTPSRSALVYLLAWTSFRGEDGDSASVDCHD